MPGFLTENFKEPGSKYNLGFGKFCFIHRQSSHLRGLNNLLAFLIWNYSVFEWGNFIIIPYGCEGLIRFIPPGIKFTHAYR